MSTEVPTRDPIREGHAPISRRRVWLVAAAVGALSLGTMAITLLADEKDAGGKSREAAEIPVRVTPAVKQDLPLHAVRRGELDADAAELSARSGGYLVDLAVGIGDDVKQGAVLAQVEPTQADQAIAEARAEVLSAQAALERASAQLAAAETENERGQRALQKGLISEKEALALASNVAVLRAEVQAAKASQAGAGARLGTLREKRRDTALTAPFDGAVAEIYTDVGTVVAPGRPILRLVRAGPLRVEFRIPERDLSLLKTGMALSLTTQATRDARFAGEITRISAEVSRVDRTVAVEGRLSEVHPELKPGMYAEVRLDLGVLEDVVVVPSNSIVDQLGADHQKVRGVFVIEDGTARFQPVEELGAAQQLSAVAGVAEGAQIVTLGQTTISDGARVRITEPL